MADVIGAIVACVDVIRTFIDLYKRVKTDINLPEQFAKVFRQLPLMQDVLEQCRGWVRSDKPALKAEVRAALVRCANKCKADTEALMKIYEATMPSKDAGLMETIAKNMNRLGKTKKVDALMKSIIESANHLVMLKEANTTTPRPRDIALEFRKLIENKSKSCGSKSKQKSSPLNQCEKGDGMKNARHILKQSKCLAKKSKQKVEKKAKEKAEKKAKKKDKKKAKKAAEKEAEKGAEKGAKMNAKTQLKERSRKTLKDLRKSKKKAKQKSGMQPRSCEHKVSLDFLSNVVAREEREEPQANWPSICRRIEDCKKHSTSQDNTCHVDVLRTSRKAMNVENFQENRRITWSYCS